MLNAKAVCAIFNTQEYENSREQSAIDLCNKVEKRNAVDKWIVAFVAQDASEVAKWLCQGLCQRQDLSLQARVSSQE